MIKKKLLYLISICFVVTSMTACDLGNNTDVNHNETEASTETSTEISIEEESVFIDTVNKGIYKYPDNYDNIFAPTVYENNGKLLFSYIKDDKHFFEIRNILGGRLAASMSLDMKERNIGVIDKGFYVYDLSGEVTIYDFDCKELETIKPENCSGYNLSISSDGKYIIYSDQNGEAHLYDDEEGKEIKLTKKTYMTEVYCFNSDGFFTRDASDNVFRIDTNGNVINVEKRKNARYIGNKFIETTEDGYAFTSPMSKNVDMIYGDVESEYVLDAFNKYMASCLNDNTIRFYNTDSLKATEALDLGNVLSISMGYNEYATMLCITNQDSYELYMVNLGQLEFNNDLKKSNNYDFGESYEEFFEDVNADSEEVKKLIDEIYETYNVRIFFEVKQERDNELLFHFCKKYTGNQLEIVKAIKEFMELSPKDIYRQVTDKGNEVWVMVSDDITSQSGDTVDAAGLAFRIGDNPFIVIEAANTIDTMIDYYSHEFIHTLDYAVGVEDISKWNDLSPENAYFGSYIYPDQADLYTFGTDGYNAYFTDAYGRTFPEEDRARIGEYIYLAYMYDSEDVFSAPGIKEKASKLSQMYRNNYPCLNDIPEGEWYLDRYSKR